MNNRKRPKRNRLTPELAARIRAGKAAGATYAELAARFGVAEGSVRNALTMAPRAPVSAHERSAAEAPVDAPEVLRGTINRLVADAERLRAEGDVAGTMAAVRLLIAAVAQQNRLPRDPTGLDGMTVTPTAELVAAREKARARLHGYIERALRTRAEAQS